MKKILLSFLAIAVTLVGSAQTTYTEDLVVSINGQSVDPVPAEISVTDNGDNTCTFQLKNFTLVAGESSMPVGTITLENVQMEDMGSYTNISTTQTIQIVAGDDPNVDPTTWMGPALGDVPIVLSGRFNGTDLYANIDIDMTVMLGQTINVTVGEDFVNQAKTYTEDLVVSINGQSVDPIPAEISVTDNGDNTCTFQLKNFTLVAGESSMPVGTITLENVQMEDMGSYTNISTTQTIQIVAGDDANVDPTTWMGPALGDVPIVLSGRFTDDHLYADIDIDMTAMLGQTIKVTVGDATTSINKVTTDKVGSTAVYTLGGVHMANSLNDKLPKGVYIVGGKKVLK